MRTTANKKRFREYGFATGFLPTGPRNAISDVRGVTVGHTTIVKGARVRTGVTVIDPGVPRLYSRKIPAAVAVGNGAGKVAGFTQVEEYGTLEAPLALTNTLSVGAVMQGIARMVVRLEKRRMQPFSAVNVVVGECNDGILNDIHGFHVTEADAVAAYRARTPDFKTGSVGAGTGTRCFSWKGGIGTASRVVRAKGKRWTVGVLVQTNYGGALAILGVPVGQLMGKTDYRGLVPDTDGSCMTVLATNAPLTSRQLRRLAARTFMGLARTGTMMRTQSGDYAIAFSTSRAGLEGSGSVGRCIPDNDNEFNGLLLAAAEATEEAVYDALFAAEAMKGRDGSVLEAIPKERVIALLRSHRNAS